MEQKKHNKLGVICCRGCYKLGYEDGLKEGMIKNLSNKVKTANEATLEERNRILQLITFYANNYDWRCPLSLIEKIRGIKQ